MKFRFSRFRYALALLLVLCFGKVAFGISSDPEREAVIVQNLNSIFAINPYEAQLSNAIQRLLPYAAADSRVLKALLGVAHTNQEFKSVLTVDLAQGLMKSLRDWASQHKKAPPTLAVPDIQPTLLALMDFEWSRASPLEASKENVNGEIQAMASALIAYSNPHSELVESALLNKLATSFDADVMNSCTRSLEYWGSENPQFTNLLVQDLGTDRPYSVRLESLRVLFQMGLTENPEIRLQVSHLLASAEQELLHSEIWELKREENKAVIRKLIAEAAKVLGLSSGHLDMNDPVSPVDSRGLRIIVERVLSTRVEDDVMQDLAVARQMEPGDPRENLLRKINVSLKRLNPKMKKSDFLRFRFGFFGDETCETTLRGARLKKNRD